CPGDKPATLHHGCIESNEHGQEVWPLRVVQEQVEQAYGVGEDEYPTWILAAENKRCRTCCKQSKCYRVKRPMARLVVPNELRADYHYCTDNQGKSHVCTPMASLPPANPW